MQSAFELIAILLSLSALFGYLNHRVLHLPHTIGLVVIALAVSLAILGIDLVAPGLGLKATAAKMIGQIDFTRTLMEGVLSFLLFAGALHVDLSAMLDRKYAIGIMATFGVLLTTALVGGGIYLVFLGLGVDVPLLACFVFGALIAPTDPVAVLSILKTVHVPPSLEAKIAGESLFNDGVGIVVFTIMVAIALGAEGGHPVTAGAIAELFVVEAIGGAVLGLVAGYLAYRTIGSIDEHNLEVLITLALVTLTYAIALALHISGPIAMVVAGILIGNHGKKFAMSETTRDHLFKFWSLTDEVLNSILFLMIGFEVLALTFTGSIGLAMVAAVPIVLVARFIAVAVPITGLSTMREFTKGAIPVLTWGGLRGGISVALALSLPAFPDKNLVLAMTYGVVIFSIVVQGLTVGRVVQRVVR
ncbi:MAG: sodium:proton antiporter [Alphaproteobacteria bacterium]|nr:sodium:proton antiporter [Alphaproteobacteria bacterium]